MTLTPLLKVVLVMNNYFHDVATALLLSSAVILWVLGEKARREGPEAVRWLASAYPVLTRFAVGALVWIVIGGVPRTIFFSQLEWDPAKTKFMVPALGVKHMIMAAAVIAGSLMWARMRKMARVIEAEAQAEASTAPATVN